MRHANAANAILSATVLVALIASQLARADPDAPTTPVVSTTAGKVQGEVVDGVYTFKGIPYAANTSGANRWTAPKDPEPWSDVRDVTTFMDICPQPADQTMGIMDAWMGASDLLPISYNATEPTSENCLGLNVYTPALDEKLPVMVWIHGGGLMVGSSSQYPGKPLVSYSATMDNPVILVTINYRLGFLGYFPHPELSEANFGLLDQIKALEWVRENIESFGGDPSNVTIFGESAGGASVLALMASPLSEGLFQKAIGESSAMEESHSVTVSEGGKLGVALGYKVGVPAGPDQLEKMREVSFDKIEDAQNVMNQDGEVVIMYVAPSLPLPVFTAFEEGKTAQVPLMIGTNANEYRVYAELGPGSGPGAENTTESYEAWVESVYGPEDAKTILSIFPSEDMSASQIMMNASAQVMTTAWFGAPAISPPTAAALLGTQHSCTPSRKRQTRLRESRLAHSTARRCPTSLRTTATTATLGSPRQ